MIKRLPADFIVEEQADLPLRPAGEFRVYSLQKSDWTTPDLIRQISLSARIPANRFSYGGKKDKHGRTSQFIAVQDPRDLGRRSKDFSLEAVGFMDRPMGPDLIRANSFTVTVRDLTDTRSYKRNAEEIGRSGFPNYFDDQRFRSYDPERGYFAEKILRRHWNGALQVYLTSAVGPARNDRGRLARHPRRLEGLAGLSRSRPGAPRKRHLPISRGTPRGLPECPPPPPRGRGFDEIRGLPVPPLE